MKNNDHMKNMRRLFGTLCTFLILFIATQANAQVTVNPGGNTYATVNAAFAAINAGTHTGAVTIAIGSNTTEPAAPTVLAASGVGAASYSSVTIYPTAAGVIVSGPTNVSRAVLEFNGADNVTINGNLNNGTGTSRDLTIRNTTGAVTNAHSVLWFQGTTTSPALGCTNIVIKNTTLQGNGNLGGTSGTTTYSTGIAFAGTTFPSATTLGANHQNITITNNQVKQVSTGIHIGNATTAPVLNLSVTGNEIGSATASEYVYYRGMWMSNISGAVIQQNHIFNIRPSLSTQTLDRMGIEVAGTGSSAVLIDRNRIHSMGTFSTSGYAGYGINANGGNSHTIINNVVYDIEGYGWGTSQANCPEGIRLSAGTGHKVYYNSVHLFGSLTGPSTRYSSAFVVAATSVTGIDVRNNIFSNRMVPTSATAENMAMWFVAAYPFGTAGNTFNNNAFFVTPSSVNHFVAKVGVTAGSGTYQSLALWQAASSGDAQSIPVINLFAPFTSNTDLTIPAATSTGCESGGVAIASLGLPNTDYTGANRPAGTGTAPDMGAYEFDGIAATGCNSAPSNGGTITAASGVVCSGNGTTISATGYTSDLGITYQWVYASVSGGPYTPISGGTNPGSVSTGALTANTYFRLEVTCSNTSQMTPSNEIMVTVNDPQLTSTTPGSRCGFGSVNLGATSSTGIVNWFAAPTGGSPIFTGTTFATPNIGSTTTYYASAASSGTSQISNHGVPNVTTSTQNTGVLFTLNTDVILNSIDVYSSAVGTVTVTLLNSSLATIYTSSPYPITNSGLSTPQTVPLGWAIPAGTNYRILVSNTGNALGYHTGAFPVNLGNGVGQVTNGATATGTSTLNYFVYNMNTTSGCQGPRTAVTATVNPAPAITAGTSMATICSGNSATLTASSSNPDYSYTWTPGGLTGASVVVSPTATTTYTVTGTDISGGAYDGCAESATVTVNVIPATVSVVGTPESICTASGSSVLSLNPASGYPAGSVQWQDSPDGTTYTDITGANSNTYTTPTLSTYQYYRAVIVDANNNVCVQPSKLITVGVPTVDNTTPASRCGSGTVTLGATTSFGSTAQWYANATGGSALYSGASYTTPNLSTTTTYYVSANTGGNTLTTGRLVPQAGSGTVLTTYGQDFTITQSITLNSVRVISTTGTSITVSLYSSGGTTQLLTTGAISVPTNDTSTISLGWSIAPGTYRLIANGMTGNFIRENSTVTYPIALGSVGQVNGFVSAIAGSVTTTASYYWFYSWNITIGCESARTPVVATVNPGPSITVAATDLTLCPGSSADLSVTSANDPSFMYTWSSSPAGFTATGAGPHQVTPSVTTKYYVVALDTSSGANAGCGAIDSITVVNTGALTAGTITSSVPELCVSGDANLTLTGANGGVNQWQMSTVSSSGPWTNVGTGANTYNTGTITQTTYYQVETTCDANSVTSNVLTVTVNNPTVSSTTPATRCGYGPVTLSATSSAPTLNWYNVPVNGTPIATGNSLTTTVAATTTYYVAASSGGTTQNVGLSTIGGSPSVVGTYYMNFTVSVPVTIASVNCYFNAIGSNFVLNIRNATTLASVFTYSGTTTASGTTTPQTIPLNAVLAPGNYQMGWTTDPGTYRQSTGGVYPQAIPGVFSITGNSFNDNNYWYYFYQWVVSSGCEGPRVPVVATVTPAPSVTLSSTYPVVCTGGSTDLAALSSNDPSYQYIWTSSPAGLNYNGAGPFTVSPTSTTKYYLVATDTTTGANAGCVVYDSLTVISGGTLNAGSISASQTSLCINGNNTTILTSTGAAGGLIEWQSASSSSGPWTTVQTGGTTYTSPALTQDTYYQLVVSCSNTSLTSNQLFIQVNNPSLLSTTGATRCGPGSVTLNATTAAAAINWYNTASGGASLGTGTSFTTNVTGTTTFYAAASDGSSLTSLGLPNNVGVTTNSGYSDVGLMFDALQAFTLQSVAIYPVATTPSGDVTATIALKNAAGTILQSTTVSVPTSVSPGIKTLVTLNFNVPAGTGHRLVFTSASGGGISGFIREITTGFTYPYTTPGVASITSAYTSGASSSYYYYFYDWKIVTACEGVRTPVVATVTASPSVSLGSDITICSGQSTTLTATSTNDPEYSYVFNTGYNGASYSVSPVATTTYSVIATDTTAGPNAGCSAMDTIVVTVNPSPLTPTISQNPTVICGSVPVTLVASSTQPGVAQVGTATTTTSTSGITAFSSLYEGAKIQYLITASELNALGVYAGQLTSLAFNVTTLPTTNLPLTGYSIKVGSTSGTTLSTYVTGLTQVYAAPTSYAPVLGWNTFNFSAPYNWDGVSSVVFEICHNNDQSGTCTGGSGVCYASGNATVEYSLTSGNTVYGKYGDNGTAGWDICGGSSLPGSTITTFNNRPNMKVGYGSTTTFLWSTGGTDDTLIVTPPTGSTTYSVTATNIFGCTASNSITVNAASPAQPYIVTNDTSLCAPSVVDVIVGDSGPYSGGYPSTTNFEWFGLSGQIVPPTPGLDTIPSIFGSSYFVLVTLPNGCTAMSDTAYITTKAVAIVDTIVNASCSSLGSIKATVTQGIAPYHYVWSTDLAQSNVIQNTVSSSTQDMISNLAAGTYYLSVSDEYGLPGSCSSGVLTYVVGGATPITIDSTSQSNVVCNGQPDGTATVYYSGGVSPISVQWSTGSTSNSIGGLVAGTYTVIVTDASSCADTAQVVITEPAILTATLSSTPESAPGALDGTVSAVVSGGTSPYQIDWYDLLPVQVGSGSPLGGLGGGYYQVFIQDSNLCFFIDTVEVTTISNMTLNLTMLIEGMYDGAGGLAPALLNAGVGVDANECDTIYVELRDQTSPTTVLASGSGVLSTTGQASFTFPASVIGANGYIAIFHRNAVQTWSDVVTFSATMSYNFTTAATQAYSGNQIEISSGVWAFYSGDVAPQDEVLDFLDQIAMDNDASNFAFGYNATDVTGDGATDFLDQIILDNNVFNFVSSYHPF